MYCVVYLKELEHSYPFFKCGLHIVCSFQRGQYAKEEESINSQWRNLTNLSQVIEDNINSDKSCW